MQHLKFLGLALLFFVVWILVYMGLDVATQKGLVPAPSEDWHLLVLFSVQLATAALLAYGYSRWVDGPGAVNPKRLFVRFLVLALAALATVAFMLMVAIAVFSTRG